MGVARRQPGTTGSHKQVPQQQPQQARSPPAWRCVARVSRVGRKRASVAAAAGSRQAAAGLLGCTSCQRPAVPVWMPPPPHAGVYVENTVEAMQALITEDNGPRGPVAELHFVEVDIQASLAHPGNCTAEPRNSVLHRSSRHTAPIRFSRLDWCVHLAACCLLCACACVCVGNCGWGTCHPTRLPPCRCIPKLWAQRTAVPAAARTAGHGSRRCRALAREGVLSQARPVSWGACWGLGALPAAGAAECMFHKQELQGSHARVLCC